MPKQLTVPTASYSLILIASTGIFLGAYSKLAFPAMIAKKGLFNFYEFLGTKTNCIVTLNHVLFTKILTRESHGPSKNNIELDCHSGNSQK